MRSSDEISAAFQHYSDAAKAGKTWLNSVPEVERMLTEFQQTVWILWLRHQTERNLDLQAEVNVRIQDIVDIVEGRNNDYEVLEWNTDPAQLKAWIMRQREFWGDDDDLSEETVLPRLIDCCAAAVFASLEALSEVEDVTPGLQSELVNEIVSQRHYIGACLLGMPVSLYKLTLG